MIEITSTSHSAINDYLRCGKAFELGRIKKVGQVPTWWFIGGSAVHKATEWVDTDFFEGSPEEAFAVALNLEVQEALAEYPDESQWLAGGYGRNEQRYDHWLEKGQRYTRQWADKGWPYDWDQSWVELKIERDLPSGLHIVAYLDRVGVDHTEGVVELADLKSGTTRPDSDQQLGIYAALLHDWLENDFGLPYVAEYQLSAFNYMFKDDAFFPVDVSNWSIDTVDKLAQGWYRGVQSSVFIPNRGKGCERCQFGDACFLQSGDTPTTRLYDSLNPHYEGE